MIYVRIELWPKGDKANAKLLHEVVIANTGGDESTGEYQYQVSKEGGFKATDNELRSCQVKNVVRQGELRGFPRLRLYATDLLLRVLQAAFGHRNPPESQGRNDEQCMRPT